MPEHEKFDAIHNKHQPDFTGGDRGTRYERLATLAFQSLAATGAVRHNRHIIGDSGAEHQIDVLLNSDEPGQRIIVECKALSEPVGLGVVRNFKGVMDDTNPAHALILTTVGFTDEARKYADYHGIAPGFLRAIPEDHINQASVSIGVHVAMPQAGVDFSSEESVRRYTAILAGAPVTDGVPPEASVYVRNGDERITLFELIRQLMEEHDAEVRRDGAKTVAIGDWTLEGDADQLRLERVDLSYKLDWGTSVEEDRLNFATEIAELILEALGTRIIGWPSDLRRRIIKETGEVR